MGNQKKHVEISESDYPSKERIWDKMYQCRDFELSHFWQKSAFLFGFLTMCFGGYGALVRQVVRIPTMFSCHILINICVVYHCSV